MSASIGLRTLKPAMYTVAVLVYIACCSFNPLSERFPDTLLGHWTGTGAAKGITLEVTDSIMFMRRPDNCYGRYRYRFLPSSGEDKSIEAVSVGDKHPMTYIFKVTEITSERLSMYATGARGNAEAIWDMLDGTPHQPIVYTFNRQNISLTK